MKFFASGQGKVRLLVFTDLDGTLLDHKTYRFDAAGPALEVLEEKSIPLILCTSKTRAEVEKLRLKLGQVHPFIPENGAAVFIPRGYFTFSFNHDRRDGRYLIIEFGTPYSELRTGLEKMKRLFPGIIKGFGDLTVEEVAGVCGFSLAEARLAKKRGYDEPFILKDKTLEPQIEKAARALGLHLTRGSRFYHLLGANDKGKAVGRLADIYRQSGDKFISIGLGDSLNDLPLFEAVDHPILVQKPDGSYDPAVKLPRLSFAPAPGPDGFRISIFRLIDQLA
jgi:mannosyl-3-phosphoglycerate phosphatase